MKEEMTRFPMSELEPEVVEGLMPNIEELKDAFEGIPNTDGTKIFYGILVLYNGQVFSYEPTALTYAMEFNSDVEAHDPEFVQNHLGGALNAMGHVNGPEDWENMGGTQDEYAMYVLYTVYSAIANGVIHPTINASLYLIDEEGGELHVGVLVPPLERETRH